MRRPYATACIVTCVLTATAHGSPEAASTDAVRDVLRPALQASCVKCHGERGTPSGGVNLYSLRSVSDFTSDPELLRSVARALDTGLMPPAGEPPLAPRTRIRLVAELRELLAVAVRSDGSLSQAPMRRMNRFQYNNAVRDLLELRVDVFSLPERMLREYGYFRPEIREMPAELKAGSRPLGKSQLIEERLAGVAPFPQDLRAEHGFDNRGDHLTLSPLLLESFLRLGTSIVGSEDFNETTSAAWAELFAAPPEDADHEAAFRAALRALLTRAFRRPVEASVLERYVAYAMRSFGSGHSFGDSMKAAVSAALASPRFLYLYEMAGSGAATEPLDDFELASRLSFFLWGSIPDKILLDLAGEGALGDPGVLAGQVERMLLDRRVKRFCDSFPTQWLQLERIRPDAHQPVWFSEPLLLFETVLIENRPILDLVDSDFSYRSELLDSWYRDGTRPAKVPPVEIPFRRVRVTDRRQGGVITNAAVLTMTSGPLETKPITRGAWLSGVIFNDPPDPPPANVPLLPGQEHAGEKEARTFRERFKAHRTQPDCASCHAKIDPLGFALESYGPTGVWRDSYDNGQPVDASGTLFGRHPFRGIEEFKDAILAEKDLFARAFAEHLLEFALGRELGAADEPSLDRIVANAAPSGYRIHEMIQQVALSDPFRLKYNPGSRE